jgi:hypothetical protein
LRKGGWALLDSDKYPLAVRAALLVCGCGDPLFGGFSSKPDLGVAFAATELNVGDPSVAEHDFPDVARRDRTQELRFWCRCVRRPRCRPEGRRDDHRLCVLLDRRRFITSLATQNAEQGDRDEACAFTHRPSSTDAGLRLFPAIAYPRSRLQQSVGVGGFRLSRVQRRDTESVQSLEDFAVFVRRLSAEPRALAENPTTDRYLEALATWIEDSFLIPMHRAERPEPSWSAFAEMLTAATVYE